MNDQENAPSFSIATHTFPLRKDHPMGFFIRENGIKKPMADGIIAEYALQNEEGHLQLKLTLENQTETVFSPERLEFCLGIDTEMIDYPQWNEIYFPKMLRCEKTHFFGAFQNTAADILAIASPDPIAYFDYEYEKLPDGTFEHRIFTVTLGLLTNLPLPKRHPTSLSTLFPHEKKQYRIKLIPSLTEENYFEVVSRTAGIPLIDAEKFTVVKGERFAPRIYSDKPYSCVIRDEQGNACEAAEACGEYTMTLQTSEHIAEAKFYCRRPLDFYLQTAAKEAIQKPPRATTNCESYYGFFSLYLYCLHSGDVAMLKQVEEMFFEIMPHVFHFEKAEPILIPHRIQNVSTFISLLCDRYAATNDLSALSLAEQYARFLIQCQSKDGAYRNRRKHYSCVIYIAKSMQELYLTEKRAGREAEWIFDSLKLAIDELVRSLDNIETEGKSTFEDGMISCSALQVAYFALLLPQAERQPYIAAAEYMIRLHRCLEQTLVPDCRMRGGSLRYWEAQYDINCKANLFSSPHGWTAWTAYAKYYLFCLTGRYDYLKEFADTLDACLQLISKDGELRWAFCCDPLVTAPRMFPDETKPIRDGFSSLCLSAPACREKYETVTFGECYLPMISGWFRQGEQIPTGGYDGCPLIYPHGNQMVDDQGACCDNDVHEIFKCLEETALHKGFVAEREDGTYLCYGCEVEQRDGVLYLTPRENTRTIIVSVTAEKMVSDADIVRTGEMML